MRTFLRVIAYVLAALLLPLAVGAAQASATFGAVFAPRSDAPAIAPPPRPYDPGKPTAAIVLGTRGTVASDALAPYEILAATGAFNLYTVAAQPTPVPLSGGLDVVPDLTFAQLDARMGDRHADLVVVPAMRDTGTDAAAPVTAWLRRAAAQGALMLGVCNGSEELASAGLLDGRRATAHWSAIDGFVQRYPATDWVRGLRFAEDGTDRVTTAGILAGIDGTLRVVERTVGAAAAAQAAAAVGYAHYVPGPARPLPQNVHTAADSVALLNAGFSFGAPTVGVAITPGVGEIELASVFETYGSQTLATNTVALSAGGRPVTSRHGLLFVPRGDLATASVDRLLVPGADAAARRLPIQSPVAPQYVHDRPGFAFDAVLQDVASHEDVATARWAGKALEYPVDGLDLSGRAWPWTELLNVVALAVAGLGLAVGVDRGLRNRRRARLADVSR